MRCNYTLLTAFIVLSFFYGVIYAGVEVERVDPETFSYDERLQYVVSYLGIRIGTVEMLNRYDENNSGTIDETVISMRTFSGVPFLSVYTEFFSTRGDDGYFTKSATFDRKRSEWAYYYAYRDVNSTRIIVDRGYKDRNDGRISDVEIDTLNPETYVHDALTFISILRDSAHTENFYELDMLIDRDVQTLRVEPAGGIEKIEVRAFENEKEAYHTSGVLEFEGIHGLSRKYQTWISTDERRIPLKARVRIAIGSVKIRLEEYENNR